MNFKEFLRGFYILKENYEFDVNETYMQMVFKELEKKLTNQMFLKTCYEIIKSTTKKDWNEAYGFKGRPALADWLNAFIPPPVDVVYYEICELTGARLKKTKKELPKEYLSILNQNKQVKSKQQTYLNKNNNQLPIN